MSIYLLCFKNGCPIFTRKTGNLKNLPFSTAASLNGFHMFFSSLNVTLHSTQTEEWTFLWQEFQNSITLILCGQHVEEIVLQRMMELIFGAISLFVNRSEFAHPSVGERIQREAKNFGPIVDVILNTRNQMLFGINKCIAVAAAAAESGSGGGGSSSNGGGVTELQQRLKEFSNVCTSQFCCVIMMTDELVIGTNAWWDLHPVDRELLTTLLNTAKTWKNDVPVYLSKKSPYVAYRFVTIPISADYIVCVLCGKEPSYRDLQNMAQNVFQSAAQSAPLSLSLPTTTTISKHLPASIRCHLESDINVLAMLSCHTMTQRALVNYLHQTTHWNRNAYYDVLKYLHDQRMKLQRQLPHIEIDEQHCYTGYHKYHTHTALQTQQQQHCSIFLIFASCVTTHAARTFSKEIARKMTQDQLLCL